jgi:hypothetical protein
MKFLYSILLLIAPLLSYSQALHIDSTRFITGNNPTTSIIYSIATTDKGILFVGADDGNPGGIIPYSPYEAGNVLIGKIDSNRQISWIKVYGCSGGAGARSACQTADGGYAVLGNALSNDGYVTGFKGVVDMWLLRLDKDGNLLWEKCYGSSQDDGSMSIANTPDHGFILLGATNGTDGDVPNHYGGFYGIDWLVIKTDSVGNVQWSRDLGTVNDEGDKGSILSIGSSYYLVSAAISGDHDCTDTAWHTGVNAGYDVYILKLDASGNVLWDSSYGGSGTDNAVYAIFDVRDSSIVTVGSTNSTDYMVTDYHGGNDDMWAIKVNKNGTLLWQKTLGSNQEDHGTGLCAAHDSSYIVYGSINEGSIGGGDCWLSLLDNSGNESTHKIFGGTDAELPNSIITYLSGYVATGISASTVFTEGATNGRNCGGEEGYLSYLGYGLDEVPKIITAESSLIVFPNPAQDHVKAHLPNNSAGSISVINNIGQKISTQIIEYGTQDYDLNTIEWVNGIYFIIWRGEDGTVLTTKLIKD